MAYIWSLFFMFKVFIYVKSLNIMKKRITEKQLRQIIRETIEEVCCQEGMGLWQNFNRNNSDDKKDKPRNYTYGDVNSRKWK